MTDTEAITTIQNRIGEMINNDSVKKEMVKMKLSGKTNDEIQRWLAIGAIASLVGI